LRNLLLPQVRTHYVPRKLPSSGVGDNGFRVRVTVGVVLCLSLGRLGHDNLYMHSIACLYFVVLQVIRVAVNSGDVDVRLSPQLVRSVV